MKALDNDEAKKIEQAPKKSRLPKTKWAGSALFAIIAVGCFCFAAWFFFVLQNHLLGEENTFGNVTISPYGYTRHTLFNQSWDSIKVSGKNFNLLLIKPGFSFSKNDSVFFKVESEKLNLKIQPSEKKDSTTKDTTLSIPEIPKFSLPFRTRISVGEASVSIDTTLSYSAKRITLTNDSRHSLLLKTDSIQGNFLEQPVDVEVQALWENQDLALDAMIVSEKDSVRASTRGPRQNLLASQVKTSIQVNSPLAYFKAYPEEAPVFKNLKLNATASYDTTNGNIQYKGIVETKLEEFFPLPELQTTIEIKGDTSKIDFHLKALASGGGKIDLKGRANKNLDAEVQGYVKNINGLFGPQWMPLDATIHSAKKKGNMFYAKASTPVGSHVNAEIQLYPNFHIDYTGDIAPNEPWAIKWSKGRLHFKDRPQVVGEFSYAKKQMKADVKIGYIPNAYFMTADSLETTLILKRNGIHFPYGKIFSKWETFDFTGEVMWRDKHPHTSWEVIASDKGKATAYIDTRTPSIQATADNVLLSSIPFAKRFVPAWADGRVTGIYEHNFDIDTAIAKFDLDAQLQKFKTNGHFELSKRQDTVVLEKAELLHGKNRIDLQAAIVIPEENAPKRMLPVEILNAWISTREFSIPLSLLSLNDTTLSDGKFSGDLTFTESHGFHGNIEFENIAFKNIPKESFAIKEMHLFAERSKAELDAYLEIGEGAWNGQAQITFDQILAPKRHFSLAFITNNGGNIWGDGYLDSTLSASIRTDGNWLLPGGAGELQNTDLRIDLRWLFSRGLNGLTGSFYADSIIYTPLKFNYNIPVALEGKIENKKVKVTKAKTENNEGESIEASLVYAFDLMQLEDLQFWTDEYSVKHKDHSATIKNVKGNLSETEDNIIISVQIPDVNYKFDSKSYGLAEAKAHGNFNFKKAKQKDIDKRTANQLEGELLIDKLTYKKDIDVDISPRTISHLLSSLQNTLKNLGRKNESSAKNEINKSNPTNLNIKVADAHTDSIAIISSFAEFPFTIDLQVGGTLGKPTLLGELVNSGEGFIGFKELYEFDIQNFLVSWQNVPWQQGLLNISTSQELTYCTETKENQNETCPIHLDIQGSITNPQPNPYSYCGNDASTVSTYYNIFLGCVSDDPTSESMDWNKVAGSLIGKILSSTANKTLGGNYIGNIDMKMRIFSNTETIEKDSSYVKIPISLDKWVEDLSLVLGYTQDQSEKPDYEHAFEFGINYKLPFFKEAEFSHPDHMNPELSVGAMLVSKQYQIQSSTQETSNYLEKNIGLNYSYRFWSPCLLGIGNCKEYEENSKTEEATHEP